MPLHDWTRVDDGVFHAFHNSWIAELQSVLNTRLLPPGYYALGDQVAGGGNPDVLALHELRESPAEQVGTALMTAPPRTRLVARSERERYTARQRRMVIRHTSGDHIVAMVEIVSAGNKSNAQAWRTLIDKALAALHRGVHLLILDLYPPTPRDPDGFHGALWSQLDGDGYELPPDANRTLAAYSAGPVKTAYVEPVAVGQVLRDMPLFLSADGEGYVEVPLEATYQAAYSGMPGRYRDILEAPG